MLPEILLSMIQHTKEENILKLLQSQNGKTLKKIIQCFAICEYDNNMSKLIDSFIDKANIHCEKIMLYDTNNFDENEKNVLSVFENNFGFSFSKTKPFILDVMTIVFSYFYCWEIFKSLALVDKKWNTVAKLHQRILYYRGPKYLTKEHFSTIKEIHYVDYRREEDGKFVKATYVNTSPTSSKIVLKHSSNIANYKSGFFDPSKYTNIMAFYSTFTHQNFVKNECLLKMKNELIQGKIMDTRIKDCYLIYNNFKYFQIRISEWTCGIIYDLSCNDVGNNGESKNNAETQPYTSQIPLIVDITEWCKIKCKNDEPDTIYHNLYSYDYENKQFIKIEKNILNHELILFQYWVHGDFINEISPFQSHSSLEEQQKMRKVLPIVQTCSKYNENEKVINSDILKLNLIQQ